MGCRGDNLRAPGADDFGDAQFDGFRTLRHFAQDQHRFSERRRFFLDTARIRQDQARLLHRGHQVGIDQRLAEHDLRMVRKQRVDGRAHVGIGVDGVEHFQLRKLATQVKHGVADIGERRAEILAPVRGQQNVVIEAPCRRTRELGRRKLQRIDYGVAGAMNPRRGDMLGKHVGARALGRAEMQLREPRDRDAVELFGKRIRDVEGA